MLTPDEIFEAFPELTTEMKKEAEKLFTHYILYTPHRNNRRDCECTYCRAEWSYPKQEVKRGGLICHSEMSEIDTKIYNGKYNDMVICPHCCITAVMKTSKKFGNGFYRAETKKIIFVIPDGYNKVYMRAYYVSHRPNTQEYDFSETARYYIADGESCAWKYIYDYTLYGGVQNGYTWRLSKRIVQPFSSCSYGAGTIEPWRYIGVDLIKDTFLKYSQYESFYKKEIIDNDKYYTNSSVYKLFCLYAKYPQIEMLMKAKFYNIVHSALYREKLYKRYLNWKADNFTDFFGLNKKEIQILQNRNIYYQLDFLKRYKDAKKTHKSLPIEEYAEIHDSCGLGYIEDFDAIVKKYNMPYKRLHNYILGKQDRERYEARFILYRDYINMAEKLNYDLNNEVVMFPKKIRAAHNTAVRLYNAVKIEAEEKKMRSLTVELYKKYHYENDEYIIRIPESMQEIIEEGKALAHCVGSYAERHANGKTVILFLRRKTEPDEPFFTIEMRGEDYRQIQGYKNSAKLEGATKEFFDNFLEYIAANGAKHRKSKPAAEQVLMAAV